MSRKIKVEEKTPFVARNEILQVADMVAREKGIERDDILDAMEQAVLKTAQMKYGEEKKLEVVIDRKTGAIDLYRLFTISETVNDPHNEIALSDVLKKDGNYKVGDVLRDKLPALDFGRVAAQSARQVITQKVRAAERNKQYEDFAGRVGEIISGVVKRIEYSDIVLDILDRTEGIIKRSETIPRENFRVGDRVKVFLVGLNKDAAGPLLKLSRTHPDFLKKLFEQEVPEVYDGIVKIVAVARDPGSKAKVAVMTNDPKLDPVGACVGVKGSRVQAITEELKGEKIDIIPWAENPAMFIVNSLAPADVTKIVM
ncbi:MAG: transcription termination factor NusA, partial [Alphaproteobacteria bacterium]|nr:transcription termination factor NusA [Alphaproteobacteria bacterium]